MFDNKKWIFTSGYVGFNLKKNASLASNGLLIQESDGIAISTTDGNAPSSSNIDLANSYIVYNGVKHTASSIVIDSSRLTTNEDNRLKFQNYESSNGIILQINADTISATWYGDQHATYPSKFYFVKTGANAITVNQNARYGNFVFISEPGVDIYPNQAPTNIRISSNQISESASANTLIGTLLSDDQRGGTISYSLVDSANYPNNSKFTIVNGQLQLIGVLDYETQTELSIKVRATDPQGLYADAVLSINVTDDLADNALVLTSSQFKMINGRIIVSHNRDPRVASFLIEGGGEVPRGSFFRVSAANGQSVKLIKNINNYFEIPATISPSWNWSESSQEAWNILHGF